MLSRIAMLGIIAFWAVMMAMLVRLETHPENTDILVVPVSYVARIVFKHGQQSLLTVREGEKPIGSVDLRPSTAASGGRSLGFSGSLAMQLPLASRHRLNFDGAVDLDSALRGLGFHVDLTMQEYHYRLSVKGDASRKTLACEVTQGGQRAFSQTLPMDATLGPALLQDLGIEPTALPMIAPAGISPPAVSARETQITLHGEQLEVYQVSVREGTAIEADFFVTELGQLVLAKTNFGYSLTTADYE